MRRLPNLIEKKLISFNIISMILFSIFIFSLLWSISIYPHQGIKNTEVLLSFCVSFISFFLFVLNEKYNSSPIINLNLFKNLLFVVPMLGTIAFGVASAIIFIIPPFFLEKFKHFSPWQVGLISFCAPLGLVLLSWVSGKLMKKYNPNKLLFAGLTIMLISLFILCFMKSNWHPIMLALLLFLYGIGGGIFQTPSISIIMGTVDQTQQATVGAINRMVQNASIAIGVSMASTLMTVHSANKTENLIIGFKYAWLFATIVVFLACASFFLFYKNSDEKG